MLLKQRLVTPLAFMFMAVQSVAALCGGGLARVVMDSSDSPIGYPVLQRVAVDGTGGDVTVIFPQGRAFFGEMVATSALAYVALHAFTSEKTTGNGFFGLSIGLAVCGLTGALLTITGGALSPALGLLGLCAEVKNDDFSAQHNIWIYWVAPPFGATVAAVLFHIISFDEVDPPHRIMAKNTALATLDPTEQHYHAYFLAGGVPGNAAAGPPAKRRLSSTTQGDFVVSTRGSTARETGVALPPPDSAPPTQAERESFSSSSA